MALYRARDRRHEYGRWWHHATFCELHSMHKLPKLSIAQMRQAKPTAAPLTGTASPEFAVQSKTYPASESVQRGLLNLQQPGAFMFVVRSWTKCRRLMMHEGKC